MYVQPNKYQPGFNGRIHCVNCIKSQNSKIKSCQGAAKNQVIDLPSNIWKKLNEMVAEEPYDIFIHPNLHNEEFFNVDAGVDFSNVIKGIQGKVKVKYDALDALPLAIKDAIKSFEDSLCGIKTGTAKKEPM